MTPEIKNNAHSAPDYERTSERIAADEEVLGIIGPAVKETVAQYHTMLRRGLEQEVKRIIDEFDAATVDIEATIIKRVKSRLLDLVRHEVRRVFDEALSSAENGFMPGGKGSGIFRVDSAASEGFKPFDDSDREPPGGEGGLRIEYPGRPPSSPGGWAASQPSPVESNSDDAEVGDLRNIEQERMESDAPSNWSGYDLDDDATELSVDELDELDDADSMYEGTVHLNVEANSCIREVVHFVRELRQKPQLRLLRLVGNNRMGVDIWLALREPLQLDKMLPQLEGVSVVSTPVGDADDIERRVSVRLLPSPREGEIKPDTTISLLPHKQQVTA